MRKNVIFIICDCLRFDRIHDYQRELTPNMDELLDEAVYFENAYSVGPNTPNSYPSIFGGIYPSETMRMNQIPQSIQTIPEVFKNNGYKTFGLVEGNAWLSKFFNYDRGFNELNSFLNLSSMHDAESLSNSNNRIWNIIERKIPKRIWSLMNYFFRFKDFISSERRLERLFFKTVEQTLINLEVPTFMWVHFMTTHYPLVPRIRNFSKRHNTRKVNSFQRSLGKLRDLYDDCVLSFDYYIGRTVEILKESGLFEDTILIITSDHGELLRENYTLSHPSRCMFDEKLMKVPLIIKFDGSKIKGKINDLFSIIGLFKPSIFNYLGLRRKNKKNIKKEKSFFRIKGNSLAINQNNYIFHEAREFQDAFTTLNQEHSKVRYYSVRNDKSCLFYDSKDKAYGKIGELNRKSTNLLKNHISKSRKSREKIRIKESVNEISIPCQG